MQMEARVGVVVEGGGQRSLNSVQGSVVDGGARQFVEQKQSLYQQSQIGTVSQLLAGGIAGAVSKTCTAPLARLTILFQVQGMHTDVATLSKASIWREASRIVCEEGFRAFWKGNLVTIAHRLPYSSVSFYSYERYKNLLQSVPGLESHRENIGADVCVRLLGGGLAGITAASVTYPLDLVRTRLAAQITATEFFGLMAVVGVVLETLLSSNLQHFQLENVLMGILAGTLLAVLILTALYLVKTNVTYYRGIWHTLQTICRDESVFGLYKGLGATLLGVGPSIAISFSVYETLRCSWQTRRPQDSTALVSLACGSLSGIASSTVTFPLDLVRRRKQLEGAGGRARVYNSGLFGTFQHIVRTEGFRGLYRGILPEYYKVVPSVGIVFTTYETIKMLLSE